MDGISVIKESGELETFNKKKILRSLMNAGASQTDAEGIVQTVIRTVTHPLTTKKIFKAVKKHMRSLDTRTSMRYSLKRAIFALGPTGYPFEKYVARILSNSGYETEVGRILQGRCVSHEVDVVAHKGSSCYIVECKFHKDVRGRSSVQTALYMHARYLDIKAGDSPCGRQDGVLRCMLVTNTRLSDDAVRFAECVGMKALGWKHPVGGSLESIIDSTHSYPVTVLHAVNSKNIDALLRCGIVLTSDVHETDEKMLIKQTGLDPLIIARLKEQAHLVSI